MTHEATLRKSQETTGLSHTFREHICRYFNLHEDQLPHEGLYERVLREMEKPLIEETLARVNGNQIRASRVLGINRNTLRKKIKELNISISKMV